MGPFDLHQRNLDFHRLIAQKVAADMSILDMVRERLLRWRKVPCTSTQVHMAEWESILAAGDQYCLQFLTEDSEQARSLRHLTPFTGILTAQEVNDLHRKWQQDNVE